MSLLTSRTKTIFLVNSREDIYIRLRLNSRRDTCISDRLRYSCATRGRIRPTRPRRVRFARIPHYPTDTLSPTFSAFNKLDSPCLYSATGYTGPAMSFLGLRKYPTPVRSRQHTLRQTSSCPMYYRSLSHFGLFLPRRH